MTDEEIKQKAEEWYKNTVKINEWNGKGVCTTYMPNATTGFIAGAKLMQKELYAETEKFKADCLELCKLKDMRIEQLENQINKMKNCVNCDNGHIEGAMQCDYVKLCKNHSHWKLKE